MTWWQATHNQEHSGMLGSAGPERSPALTGAWHPFAGLMDGFTRNASRLARGAGRAASHPPELPGVITNDASHHPELDGHSYSHLAHHPDGLFASNTAASSSHSLLANLRTFFNPTATGVSLDQRTYETVDPSGNLAEILQESAATRESLSRQRRTRLEGEQELLVGHEYSHGLAGVAGSFVSGEWNGMHAIIAGLGVYAGLRAFM